VSGTPLDIFQNTPGAALLWFDYWIDASRKGRLESVAATQSERVGIFAETAGRDPGVDDPEGRHLVLLPARHHLPADRAAAPPRRDQGAGRRLLSD
jgi:hypothetical protein